MAVVTSDFLMESDGNAKHLKESPLLCVQQLYRNQDAISLSVDVAVTVLFQLTVLS